MPKNKVNDLITDQEMVFARLILSGTMTDQQAAKAAGLNPNTAAYIKSKPCVRAYMLEYRALMQQQLVQQQAQDSRRQHLDREQVLARLWEIASLNPDMTRNSISGQVKALTLIIAILGLIPNLRAGSAQNKPAPQPTTDPQIYANAWLAKQQEQNTGSEPTEEGLATPPVEPAADASRDPGSDPSLNSRPIPSESTPATSAPAAPDTRVPNPLGSLRLRL